MGSSGKARVNNRYSELQGASFMNEGQYVNDITQVKDHRHSLDHFE